MLASFTICRDPEDEKISGARLLGAACLCSLDASCLRLLRPADFSPAQRFQLLNFAMLLYKLVKPHRVPLGGNEKGRDSLSCLEHRFRMDALFRALRPQAPN